MLLVERSGFGLNELLDRAPITGTAACLEQQAAASIAEEKSPRPKYGRSSRCDQDRRSEEHTSELQSLMRISYAVFCLKKKTHSLARDTHYHPSSLILITTKPIKLYNTNTKHSLDINVE